MRETGIDSLNTEDISIEEFKDRMDEIFIEIQKKPQGPRLEKALQEEAEREELRRSGL
jgi:hypothetical protein